MLGHWERVIPVYIKLFQECKILGPPSTFRRATAILINLFLSVSNTLELHESQERTDGVGELSDAKNKISKELNTLRDSDSLRGLIQSFKELYKLKRQKCQDLDLLETPERHPKDPASTEPPGSLLPHPEIFSKIMTIESWELSNEDVRARDIFGWTLLHYAAVRGDEDVMTKLLGFNADPNALDLAEWTPMHYSIENINKKEPQSIVSALLRGGADTGIRGRDGMAPLHCAAKQGYAQVIRILIRARASVNIQDTSGKTPLHWAAYTGSAKAINILLEYGAYAKARDDYERTPLHLAALAGWEENVERFLGVKKLKRDSIDRDGRTPLHLAAIKGSEKVMRLLLDKNETAMINAVDNNERTPLDLAIRFERENAAVLLSNMYGISNSSQERETFGTAILFGRVGAVEKCVARLDKKDLKGGIKFARVL